MFLGEYTHTIDDKGRLTIPAKYRGDLASGLVVTRGLDRNLILYPMEAWLVLARKVSARPITDSSARSLRRRLFSGATDLIPDRQGRIVLPAMLREFAGLELESEATLVGQDNYIEIWRAADWSPVRDEIESEDGEDRWAGLDI
jgi:MraZ protein